VEGKGIVLIIGCGHQTIEKYSKNQELLMSDLRIIGGLHYPSMTADQNRPHQHSTDCGIRQTAWPDWMKMT